MNEWDSYVEIAESKRKQIVNRFVSGKKKPYEQVERSAPIILGDKIFFVRVLYAKAKKKMVLDIRQYELEQSGLEDNFNPTVHGNILSIEDWEILWTTVTKLSKKWKER